MLRPVVTLSYGRVDGRWEPWTLVTESALLRLVHPPVPPQVGLYAARFFHKPRESTSGLTYRLLHDVIAHYSGCILGRFKTREEARQDVFDYIEMFYNPVRKHVRNGMLSPVEFERQQKMKTEGV